MRIRLALGISAWFSLAAGAQSPPATFQQTVAYQGSSHVVDFALHSARGPNFTVLVAQSNGSLANHVPGPVRTYIGTIANLPGAMASAVRRANGAVCYHVLFEDGAEWINNGGSTTLRTDASWTAAYPSFVTGAGGAGSNVWAAEVGVDVPFSQYAIDNDVDRALEMVEHSVNTVNLMYLRDACVTHRIGRVVVRANLAVDPYAGLTATGDLLNAISQQWNSVLPPSTHDLGLVATSATGGGVAYVGVVGNPGYSANGATTQGDFTIVWRHEVGHNWSLGHYDGSTPEGATINSGNQLSRMSGPEQALAIKHRNARLAHLDNLGPYATAVPPRASLDRVPYRPQSAGVVVDVLGNDHDANGEAFTISGFDASSELGGVVSLSPGTGPGGRDQLLYSPPVTASAQVDHFTYRITDAAGREGLGNVVSRLTFDATMAAHFSMDAGSGAVANDSSSFARHAALQGGASWTAGAIGGGIAFDGVDDRLVAETPDQPSNRLTVTGWVRRSGAQSSWAGIAFWRGGTTTTGFGFGTNNELRYHWAGSQWQWSSGLVVPDNTWTFVALVVQPGSATIYMDPGTGMQSATNPASHALEAFDTSLTIGQDPSSSSRYFRGLLDDVRVHSRALTPAEIVFARNGLGSAADPTPAQLAPVAGQSALLAWTGSPAATAHRVFLSSDYAAVRDGLAVADRGLTTANSWATPLLSPGSWFWRVDATDGANVVAGPIWSFTPATVSSVLTYGIGCPGTNALTPAIGASGVPRIATSSFGVTLTDALPQAPAVLLFSTGLAFVPVSGCHLLLTSPVLTFPVIVTDAIGQGIQVVPIPDDVQLIGLSYHCQFLVGDPGGALFGFASMSNGLRMKVVL